jgi:hypothetical protein
MKAHIEFMNLAGHSLSLISSRWKINVETAQVPTKSNSTSSFIKKAYTMLSKKFGLRVAGLIFGVVAILHLIRLLLSVPVLISDYSLPVWVSYVGFVVTAFLSAWFWKLASYKDV